MRKLFYPILILVLSLAFFVFFTDFRESVINPFQEKSLIAKTIEKIENIDIAQLRNTQYIYKSIFPFDYIYGVPNWGILLYKDNKYLSDEDKHNLDFYYKCKKIGINLNTADYFVIIKTHATAGFDLDKYMEDPILLSDEERGKLIIKSPESELLHMAFLDSLKNENHPDFNVTPEQWQKLTILLTPIIEKRILKSGILEESDKLNRSFLIEFFTAMKWNTVEFK